MHMQLQMQLQLPASFLGREPFVLVKETRDVLLFAVTSLPNMVRWDPICLANPTDDMPSWIGVLQPSWSPAIITSRQTRC